MSNRFVIISGILCFFLSCNFITAQKIDIRIYHKYKIRSIVLSPVEGKYDLLGDSEKLVEMKKHNVILVDVLNDSLYVRSLNETIGKFKSLEMIGKGKNNYFRIKPIDPEFRTRDYDDNLKISLNKGSLLLLNNVELENYISGVVKSEGGTKSTDEYYKCQAVICRTYALENLFRHNEEEFNLCDDVHCQAYHGKCLNSEAIINATNDTKGLIIVDTTLSLITATFHSNCGGQTMGSEDVWLTPRSYLKSVKDSFCISGRNSTWTKTIDVKKWEEYLKSYGFNLSYGSFNINNYSYSQSNRKKYYNFNDDSIPLKVIRSDWKLKSTYFDVVQNGNKLLFMGKGYGHGVGMCQEGAMNMAKKGYPYEEIIKFYYRNIYIVSLRALEFFKEDE